MNELELPKWDGPAILLVDLDAFFASVEQLDHSDWRGKPVIVGGSPDSRGVVSTCSYEAREYGVRSAMPSSQAARLCPDAIWVSPHFDRYHEISDAVMSIIGDETPLVQQVSIDEAFADITPNRTNRTHPFIVAKRIQDRVAALGVTCSIGLSTSKAVSKLASDIDKPQGLTVVFPGTERGFMSSFPIEAMSGIGRASSERLRALNIKTLGEMSSASIDVLRGIFGVRAEEMRDRAKGKGDSAIEVSRSVKSVSHETSFEEDLQTIKEVRSAAVPLLANVGYRLRAKGLSGTTLTVKMRFDDRTLHTAQAHFPHQTNDDFEMKPVMFELIEKLWTPIHKVRLLGVGVSGFGDDGVFEQEGLFGDFEQSTLTDESKKRLLETFDSIKDKYGKGSIGYASEL